MIGSSGSVDSSGLVDSSGSVDSSTGSSGLVDSSTGSWVGSSSISTGRIILVFGVLVVKIAY